MYLPISDPKNILSPSKWPNIGQHTTKVTKVYSRIKEHECSYYIVIFLDQSIFLHMNTCIKPMQTRGLT